MITLRRMMWAQHIVHIREEKWIQKLVGEPEDKISVERPRRGWQHSIKTYLKEIRWEGELH
jgi:hypothetical protein